MDLVTFLAARLDEDEAEAKGPPGWKLEHWTAVKYADKESGRNWRVDAEPRCVVDAVAKDDALFIARHDPARVLREVEAGRKILAWYADSVDASDLFREKLGTGTHMAAAAESYLNVIRAKAAVYSDHPDYDEAWKP